MSKTTSDVLALLRHVAIQTYQFLGVGQHKRTKIASTLRHCGVILLLLTTRTIAQVNHLPHLTYAQQARESAYIRKNYFTEKCLIAARQRAPKMKDKGGMAIPSYHVELGLTDETPDGGLHTISVVDEGRMAYFQEGKSMQELNEAPIYGPVSLTACLQSVLVHRADNCSPFDSKCPLQEN